MKERTSLWYQLEQCEKREKDRRFGGKETAVATILLPVHDFKR